MANSKVSCPTRCKSICLVLTRLSQGNFLFLHAADRARQPQDAYICLYKRCTRSFTGVYSLDLHVKSHFNELCQGQDFIAPKQPTANNDTTIVARHNNDFVAGSSSASSNSAQYAVSLTPNYMESVTPDDNPSPSTDRNDLDSGLPPTCPTCKVTFTRLGDLQRHAKKHDATARIYGCPVDGCTFKPSYRKDKLTAHMQSRHKDIL